MTREELVKEIANLLEKKSLNNNDIPTLSLHFEEVNFGTVILLEEKSFVIGKQMGISEFREIYTEGYNRFFRKNRIPKIMILDVGKKGDLIPSAETVH